jgi:hypothetical protein
LRKQDIITLLDWTETHDYAAQTSVDTVSVAGTLKVMSADGNGSLLVSTPAPILALDGRSLTSGSVRLANATDTVTATFAGNASVTLAMDGGNTGTTTATAPTSIDEMTALVGS